MSFRRVRIVRAFRNFDGLKSKGRAALSEEDAIRLEERINKGEFKLADVFGAGNPPRKIGERAQNEAGEEYWLIIKDGSR